MTTDIHTWRSLICQDLIKAGLTNSKDIVAQASNIEVYVFGDTKTAEAKPEIKNAEVKTSNPAKLKRLKKPKQKRLKKYKKPNLKLHLLKSQKMKLLKKQLNQKSLKRSERRLFSSS